MSYVYTIFTLQSTKFKTKIISTATYKLKMTRKEDENKFTCSFFPSFKQNKNFIVPDFLALFWELDGNSLKPFLSWPFNKKKIWLCELQKVHTSHWCISHFRWIYLWRWLWVLVFSKYYVRLIKWLLTHTIL